MPDYSIEKNRLYTEKTREMLKALPAFCGEFFRGVENNTSVLTRYGYANDLKIFFTYLVENIDEFSAYDSIRSFTVNDLEKVNASHIEMFMEHLTYYSNKNGEDTENHERAKARKLSAVRSFLKYFFKKERISSNVAALVDTPKLHDKPIIRLDVDEVANLLDIVEQGISLSPSQQRYHKYTKVRDVAILTLFLGTGIRISELVGINMADLNFVIDGFKITRKGGDQVILYFGQEVRTALLAYLAQREAITPTEGHEDALFLSIQRKRFTVRAIENMVKKYAQICTPLKKISPHKLRSTYGTMLYQETGDIYLVADVLGHKDVNTTRKHYAAVLEDRRKAAARVVKLRDND